MAPQSFVFSARKLRDDAGPATRPVPRPPNPGPNQHLVVNFSSLPSRHQFALVSSRVVAAASSVSAPTRTLAIKTTIAVRGSSVTLGTCTCLVFATEAGYDFLNIESCLAQPLAEG